MFRTMMSTCVVSLMLSGLTTAQAWEGQAATETSASGMNSVLAETGPAVLSSEAESAVLASAVAGLFSGGPEETSSGNGSPEPGTGGGTGPDGTKTDRVGQAVNRIGYYVPGIITGTFSAVDIAGSVESDVDAQIGAQVVEMVEVDVAVEIAAEVSAAISSDLDMIVLGALLN